MPENILSSSLDEWLLEFQVAQEPYFQILKQNIMNAYDTENNS